MQIVLLPGEKSTVEVDLRRVNPANAGKHHPLSPAGPWRHALPRTHKANLSLFRASVDIAQRVRHVRRLSPQVDSCDAGIDIDGAGTYARRDWGGSGAIFDEDSSCGQKRTKLALRLHCHRDGDPGKDYAWSSHNIPLSEVARKPPGGQLLRHLTALGSLSFLSLSAKAARRTL